MPLVEFCGHMPPKSGNKMVGFSVLGHKILQSETNLQEWIGKQQIREAKIDERHTELLAVTLGKPVPQAGDPLPECWHWAWMNDALPMDQLGRDGHPKRGGFLPPVPLPRRMWAGGSISFATPMLVADAIKKTSTITNVAQKNGKSGPLCIVTIKHEFTCGDTLCLSEQQNLVYREDPSPDAPKPPAPTPPTGETIQDEVDPNPVLMFRYSALTFNGHRIHYDVDYARNVEGYPDLVFHAPLTALNLCDLGKRLNDGNPPKSFSYRATSPLFANEKFKICAKKENEITTVWAETPEGGMAMQGTLEFS